VRHANEGRVIIEGVDERQAVALVHPQPRPDTGAPATAGAGPSAAGAGRP
jgi:hypothetical protein